MASTISSTPDEIPQRKVPMDDVTIDAEMKKDLPEVKVAKNPSVMPVPKFFLPPKPMGNMAQNGRRAGLPKSNSFDDEFDDDEFDDDYSDDDEFFTATSMNPELFKALKGGNIAFIEKARDMESSHLFDTSPKLNTILHVAASSGHEKVVKVILETKGCQQLVMRKNSAGDLALHVAASAGHLPIVKLLLSASYQHLEESQCSFEPLKEQNKRGNTPLHLALINKYQEVTSKIKYNEVARFLVETEPVVTCSSINKENKSPLYMAAEAGDVELLEIMLNKLPCLQKVAGKSIVHPTISCAFTTKNIGILDTVLRKMPHLITNQDNTGMTPLSHAASIGFLDGVQYLLEKASDCAYKIDLNGFYPIHTASKKGHIEVIEFFLNQYPDMSELLNRNGQNILHVAAVSGKAKAVAYMLKRDDLEMLINEKDNYGNTPLHLASKERHPKVVSILTWDKRASLKLLNNVGKTALDVAGDYSPVGFPSFREQLTRQALRYAGAPRAPRSSTSKNMQIMMPHMKLHSDKDRVGTLLLVAALVATVTFAAAFTVPGGYNGFGGVATFLEKQMFQVFVICNTIAMYSAIAVVVTLIWAQLGDLNFIIAALKFAVPIFGLALTMVSVAFMVGNYLVLRNLNWLAYLVLIIGSFVHLTLLILFSPLCFPSSLHRRFLRYILHYPFCLLIKVTRSDTDDRKEE
ncbi:protein ACCELERATED CELL DEATH 6-like [Castanea sativa]|uniref:protein ACCELERATED CELL DEATH 6-like n=1 Tax=Castanea sativa TaxID=21020 RepID=UPI003F6513E6